MWYKKVDIKFRGKEETVLVLIESTNMPVCVAIRSIINGVLMVEHCWYYEEDLSGHFIETFDENAAMRFVKRNYWESTEQVFSNIKQNDKKVKNKKYESNRQWANY